MFLMVELHMFHAVKARAIAKFVLTLSAVMAEKGSNDSIVGQNVVVQFCKMFHIMLTCKIYLLKVRRRSGLRILLYP